MAVAHVNLTGCEIDWLYCRIITPFGSIDWKTMMEMDHYWTSNCLPIGLATIKALDEIPNG